MKERTIERIKFITCIVDRGVGKYVIELCKQEGIVSGLLMHGRGTADSETLTLLGLGESEKDIVMLTVAGAKRRRLIDRITERMHLDEPGHGIAFSIPLSSFALQRNSYTSIGGRHLNDGNETAE